MYAEIQKLLQAHSKLLCKGQFEELVEFYHLPFVAFNDGVSTIVRNRSQAVEALRTIAALMDSRGTVGMEVEVTSVELPRNGRYRVWCHYSEIDSCGNVISQSDVVQYRAASPTGALVEMIESRNCPFAEIWEQKDSIVL